MPETTRVIRTNGEETTGAGEETTKCFFVPICSFVVAATTETFFVRRNQRGRPTDGLTTHLAAASVSRWQVKNVKNFAASVCSNDIYWPLEHP